MTPCPCGAASVITYRPGHGMIAAGTGAYSPAVGHFVPVRIEWEERGEPMHLCERCYVAQVRNQAANMGKRPPALARIPARARKAQPREPSRSWRAVKRRAGLTIHRTYAA